MSLEHDITGLMEVMSLNEGYADAKRLYVDCDPPKMTLRQLNILAGKDPTYRKVGGIIQGGKYIQWMAHKWVSGITSSRRFDVIAEFDDLSNKHKIENRDINAYRSIEELDDAVQAAKLRMGEERQSRIKIDTAALSKVKPEDIIVQNDKVVIVNPKNYEDSCAYGSQYWCVSSRSSYWGSYYQGGSTLYYLLPKRAEVVPEAEETGGPEGIRFDRFAKVAVRVAQATQTHPEGEIVEIRDQYNRSIDEKDFNSLLAQWGVRESTGKEDNE
jgi:hypothetical protein